MGGCGPPLNTIVIWAPLQMVDRFGQESLQKSKTVVPVQTIGLPDRYISQGSPEQQREDAGLSVTKIVGSITERLRKSPLPSIELKINKNEVDEVFYVPLEHFLTLENYRIQARKWQEELRYYYVVPYGPYYIWGATARILFGFAEGFKNANR